MPQTRMYLKHPLVGTKNLKLFDELCYATMRRLNITPASKDLWTSPFGAIPLDPNSVDAYTRRLRKFIQFLLKYPGLYDDSLLPFHQRCPPGTANVSELAATNFLYWVMGDCEHECKDMVGKTYFYPQSYGRRGKTRSLPMLCNGSWNDPTIADNFRTALKHLHKNCLDISIPYHNQCPACAKMYENRNDSRDGCELHTNYPRPRRAGNVATSAMLSNAIVHLKKVSNHEVDGSKQLLPSEVRMLKRHLISSNQLHLMGYYVIMLLSIDLYMRSFEFSNLKEENFNTNRHIMVGKYLVRALNVTFKGKRCHRKGGNTADRAESTSRFNHIRHRNLFGDDQCLDVDAKGWLLIYLYAIGWKGGTIFPSEKELADPPSDGIYLTKIVQSTHRSRMNHLFKTILHREDKLGNHTYRKSAYLFSYIRGGTESDIMQGADHKSIVVSNEYSQDAKAIAETIDHIRNPAEKLGHFHSCYSAGSETMERVTRPNSHFQVSLAELSRGFVEEVLMVSPMDRNRHDPSYLAEKLESWNPPSPKIDDLDELLKDVTSVKRQDIWRAMHAHHDEKLNALKEQLMHEARKTAIKERDEDIALLYEKLNDHLVSLVSAGALGDTANLEALELPAFFRQAAYGNPPHPATGDGEVDPQTIAGESPPPPQANDSESSPASPPPKRQKLTWVSPNPPMNKRTSPEKLHFMAQYADAKPSDYDNKGRQFVMKHQPIGFCFVNCCNSSVSQFLSLHRLDARSFSAGSLWSNRLKDCAACHSALTTG